MRGEDAIAKERPRGEAAVKAAVEEVAQELRAKSEELAAMKAVIEGVRACYLLSTVAGKSLVS